METIEKLNLYLVHCGFYDQSLADGSHNIFEAHHNFYVVARDPAEAKEKVKKKGLFAEKHMHVDGMHQIEVVDGYRVKLEPAGPIETEIRHVNYSEAKALP